MYEIYTFKRMNYFLCSLHKSGRGESSLEEHPYSISIECVQHNQNANALLAVYVHFLQQNLSTQMLIINQRKKRIEITRNVNGIENEN